jgi:hypothetical protein
MAHKRLSAWLCPAQDTNGTNRARLGTPYTDFNYAANTNEGNSIDGNENTLFDNFNNNVAPSLCSYWTLDLGQYAINMTDIHSFVLHNRCGGSRGVLAVQQWLPMTAHWPQHTQW